MFEVVGYMSGHVSSAVDVEGWWSETVGVLDLASADGRCLVRMCGGVDCRSVGIEVRQCRCIHMPAHCELRVVSEYMDRRRYMGRHSDYVDYPIEAP
jgi:hypothetical protein